MSTIREKRREKSPCTVNTIGDADMYRNANTTAEGIYIRKNFWDFLVIGCCFSSGFYAVIESPATYVGIISR